MVVDPLRACMDAKKELERAERELQKIGEFYLAVGGGLHGSPPRLKLSNSGMMTRTSLDAPGIDFETWPDKETAKQKLGAFYEAENAYAQAWRSLSLQERGQFAQPNP